jgi:hypothetical protein
MHAPAAFLTAEDLAILIDDTAAERPFDVPNLVRFEARRDQAGLLPITIRDLLRARLRHRPDACWLASPLLRHEDDKPVTDDEYAKLEHLAAGQTLSEWVRDVLLATATPRPADQVNPRRIPGCADDPPEPALRTGQRRDADGRRDEAANRAGRRGQASQGEGAPRSRVGAERLMKPDLDAGLLRLRVLSTSCYLCVDRRGAPGRPCAFYTPCLGSVKPRRRL